MPVNHTLCVVLRDCWQPHVLFATMLRVALLSLRAFAIFYADLGVPFVQISSASPARTKKNRNKEHLCLRTNCAHGCSIVFPEAFPVRAPFPPPDPAESPFVSGTRRFRAKPGSAPGAGPCTRNPGATDTQYTRPCPSHFLGKPYGFWTRLGPEGVGTSIVPDTVKPKPLA